MMTEKEITDLHETIRARLGPASVWTLRAVQSFSLPRLLGMLRDIADEPNPKEDFCEDPRLVEASNRQLIRHIEDVIEREQHFFISIPNKRRA